MTARSKLHALAEAIGHEVEAMDETDDQPIAASLEELYALPRKRHGQPRILKFPGAGVLWVQSTGGSFVTSDSTMLRGEIARQQPEIPLWVETKSGKSKPVAPGDLVERFAYRVDRLIYDLTAERTRYVPGEEAGGGTLRIACGRTEPIPARADDEVAKWLDYLGGEQTPKLLDWLATVTDLTRPTCALYLQGPPGCGKGMLAGALGQLWGGTVAAYDDVVGSGYNSALRDCPVAYLDERTELRQSSGAFRSLVGDSHRALTEKYRPAATLFGCVRLLVCANNHDALGLAEDLTADDAAAIGERILHIQTSNGARDYLLALGGRSGTIDWVTREDPDGQRPGRLAEHIEWLRVHREVEPGDRFLVHGDSEAWLRGANKRSGLLGDVLSAVARVLDDPGELDPASEIVIVSKGDIFVRVVALHDAWETITRDKRVPTTKRIGMALSAAGYDTQRLTLRVGYRPRFVRVPADHVIEVAADLGIGDHESLAALVEQSTEPRTGA